MVLESISQSIATSITDPFTYWTFAALIGLALYFILKLLEVQYAPLISMVVPVVLLEFLLRFIFGLAGITLDFGSYPISIPFLDPIIVTDGVMLMRFFNFIFNFGLFVEIGIPVFSQFMADAPVFPEPSLWFKAFVAFYVSVDSLIEYVFFYFVFLATLILISDILKLNRNNIKIYAMFLAALPVLAYMYFISDPFFEYGKAMPGLQQLGYFLGNADTISLAIFIITLVISFLLVMEILASLIAMFYEAGSATFKPDWVQKRWEVNVQGVGFIYTLSFAIMYSMHQYEWYIFFPAMVAYSIFKKIAGGAVTISQAHEERTEMMNYIRAANGPAGTVRPAAKGREAGTGLESNMVLYALVAFVIIMGGMLVMGVKIV